MLICSCNRIDHNRIEAEVDRQLAGDPMQFLTPTRVYKGLGERPRCGGCLPLASEIINGRTQTIRRCACEESGLRPMRGSRCNGSTRCHAN